METSAQRLWWLKMGPAVSDACKTETVATWVIKSKAVTSG